MRSFIRYSIAAVILLAFVAKRGYSQSVIDIPVLEIPYNIAHGVRAPGMQQSLALTSDYYEFTHKALARISPKHKAWTNVGITVFDYLTIAVPFADAWEHEEWHRAILGNRGIDSKDDVWNLKNIFAEGISVSHITDEDISRLKREHPTDFVR